MGKVLIKLVVFLALIVSFILILKRGEEPVSVNNPADFLDHLTASPDTSIFFIGSSRVQRSIDPQIINRHYDHFRVVNAGVPGGTFLSSCALADFIIRQRGCKVLFIELAPLVDELPDCFFNVSAKTRFDPLQSVLDLTENRSFSDRSMLMLNIINHRVHHFITVTEEVKQIVGYKPSYDRWIGFQAFDKNDVQTISPFLKWEEINQNPPQDAIDLTHYQQMIDYLEDAAKKNNTQIIFFLPITYAKQGEKNIVIPLFNSLPDAMKLEFSRDFFEQITKKEYLMDPYHLNRQGAVSYSELIRLEIQNSKFKI